MIFQVPSRHQKMPQVINNRACLQALVNKRLHGKAAVLQQIMFEKQRKHMLKHCVYIISLVQASFV